MYVDTYIYICVCVSVSVYTYIYVCVCVCVCVCVYTGLIWLLLCLDKIHDQLHAITENLQVLSAEVRSKLQDNVVVSVKGGMVVDRSLRRT